MDPLNEGGDIMKDKKNKPLLEALEISYFIISIIYYIINFFN
jgi:hypothetical protein